MGLVLSSIWTSARLKVRCQESSAAGSPGYQLTEMGRRMPWAPGGTCLTTNNDNNGAELLRKEGRAPNTGISLLPAASRSHIPLGRLESTLHRNACHPLSLGSLF